MGTDKHKIMTQKDRCYNITRIIYIPFIKAASSSKSKHISLPTTNKEMVIHTNIIVTVPGKYTGLSAAGFHENLKMAI